MGDIRITINGETRDFDLVRASGGRKVWTEQDVIGVPATLVRAEGQPGMSPLQLIALGARDWRGGWGKSLHDDSRYAEGGGIDTSMENKLILGPKAEEVKEGAAGNNLVGSHIDFISFKGKDYCLTTDHLYRRSGAYWVSVHTPTATKLFTCVGVFGDKILVGENTARYWHSSTGDSGWTSIEPSFTPAFFIESPPVTGAAPVFVAAALPNKIYTAADPATLGSWLVTPYSIGDATWPITALASHGSFLAVIKEDGLYRLYSTGAADNIMPDMRAARSARNGRHWTNWQSRLCFSTEYDVGQMTAGLSFEHVGPTAFSDGETTAECMGLAADSEWLYATMKLATRTDPNGRYLLFRGRERKSSQGTNWEWMPWLDAQSADIHNLRVMKADGTTRLWLFRQYTTGYVVVSDNPLADASYKFAATGHLVTGWMHGGYEIWAKLLTQLQAMVRNVSASGENVKVSYQKEGATSWTLLTTFTGADGLKSYDIPSANAISAKKVRMKIELNSDTDTITPVVEGCWLKGVLLPEMVRHMAFQIWPESTDQRSPANDYAFLLSGRASESLSAIVDPLGASHKVVFPPGSPRIAQIYDEAKRETSLVIEMTAHKITTG